MMSGGTFRFKRFELSHMRSSMRVGTDAVLLGAWTRLGRCAEGEDMHILDIGCGCGLIALMLAQRCPSAEITGIDIDAPSVEESMENASASPFARRVRFVEADVRDFALDGHVSFMAGYSLIVCNPPYYTEDTLPPDARRSVARNACHLTFVELLTAVCRLMAEDGLFSVVIPMQERDGFVAEAMTLGLHPCRECRVQTVVGKPPKRVLLEFCKAMEQLGASPMETLVLQGPDGRRTAEYASLCADFYL